MSNPAQGSGEPQSRATCGAKTRDGDPCRNPPMSGATRCRMHGGATPRGRAAAERRLAEAEAVRRVTAFGARTDITAPEALLELVQSKAAEVAYWDGRVAELSDDARAGLLMAKTEQGLGPQGPVDTETRQAGPHVFVVMLHKAQDQLAAYSAAAIRAGVDRAMVEAVTLQAAWLLPLLYEAITAARASAEEPAVIIRGIVERQTA